MNHEKLIDKVVSTYIAKSWVWMDEIALESYDYCLKISNFDDEYSRVRVTNTIFYTKKEKQIFLEIFQKARKKVIRGNQYQVAKEIKKSYKLANGNKLFHSINTEYLHKYGRGFIPQTPKELGDFEAEFRLKKQNQFRLRLIFLVELGLKPNYENCCLALSSTMRNYFLRSSPQAIVQMKKRLSEKK